MGVPSRRSTKRRRTAGDDFISCLNDDLLLRILDLLPDATDVVRTNAISRRWRGLWTGVSALRFNFRYDYDENRPHAAERYLAFVNGALALRASAKEPSLKDLAISFNVRPEETAQLVRLSVVAAAQGWIRYAAEHAVKSFTLEFELGLPRRFQMHYDAKRYGVMTLEELDSYAGMEMMHLSFGHAELRLPSSTVVVFASLTDLSLEAMAIKVPAGGARLLSHLVSSSCCPCLRKLRLVGIEFLLPRTDGEETRLLIEADTLLELSLDRMDDLHFCELRTPSLRILRIKRCFDLYGFIVSAPRLEDLTSWVERPLGIYDVQSDLSRVGTLKIQLFSHGKFYGDERRNDGSYQLLRCCRAARYLQVSLRVEQIEHRMANIISGRIPPLPHVLSLSIRFDVWSQLRFGALAARLLARCRNIKYLSLQLCYYNIITREECPKLGLIRDYMCPCKSHGFSLSHLQEVEFKGLVGSIYEFRLIQSILTMATRIQKVIISFNQVYRRKGSRRASNVMPPLDGGLWTTCDEDNLSYKWRRCV